MLQGLKAEINRLSLVHYHGAITGIVGSVIEVSGLSSYVSVGTVCRIENRNQQSFPCEVVGFRGNQTLVMSYDSIAGLGPGCRVIYEGYHNGIHPHESWLGRTIDGFGNPIDHFGPLVSGPLSYQVDASPLPAHERRLIEDRIDLGVRAMNTFTTCCAGQRMGIFAGSGVLWSP